MVNSLEEAAMPLALKRVITGKYAQNWKIAH